MRNLMRCILALPIFAFGACGDDTPPVPGEIVVRWNTGPTSPTCEDIKVESLLANVCAVLAEECEGESVIASGTAACADDAKSGEVRVTNVPPGVYQVVLNGLDSSGKATYTGSVAESEVREDEIVTTSAVHLRIKRASITVDWRLPGGDRCPESGIDVLEYTLWADAIKDPKPLETGEHGCESPAFTIVDLTPNEEMMLTAEAYDAEGNAIAEARTERFELKPGDEIKQVLEFEYCPGDPPNCDL